MKAKIVTHYEKTDKKFSGDYLSIDILIDNKLVIEYGDSYHDKGRERSEAFLEGYAKAIGKEFDLIEKIQKADGKC